MNNGDCDRFPPGSRLRALCEGSVELPDHKLAAYRRILAAGELPAEANRHGSRPAAPPAEPAGDGKGRKKGAGCRGCGGSATVQAPKVNGYGPGSKLLALFEGAGVPHCEECLRLAGWMDRWGRRRCLSRLDRIVADILPRARQWLAENRPVLHRLLSITHLEEAALAHQIRIKVRQAIDQAEERPAPVRPPARNWHGRHWGTSFRPSRDGRADFLTVEDLARDTLAILPKLPPDIVHVIGGARSGLVPASLLAMHLHTPLSVLRVGQRDIVPAGHGWRLREGAPRGNGTTLVIDDTVMTGNSWRAAQAILAKWPGPRLHAAVYCNPAAIYKPDIWAVDLPWPHLLEWNLFNSVILDSCAADFDGILCRDPAPADDDDGPNYARFLDGAPPLYLVRRRPLRLIVTARLEKYRAQTVAWLERWRIRARKLVMGPWPDQAARQRADVAQWKADQLQDFLAGAGGLKPRMYIESDPRQAERIAQLTGGLVVCPRARRCFGKAK